MQMLTATFSSYDPATKKSVFSGETPLDKLNHKNRT